MLLPATGGNTVSVAEYVLTGVRMLRRGAYLSTSRVLAGEWPRQALMGHETQGAILGLVGFGVSLGIWPGAPSVWGWR
ncbi:hypothetical protein [Salinicola tamaricis]|uniref:hypothetical protein n=1 Tax=Salinicola tamaricis TaxID=1771309 RepID=UPI001F5DF964|nr:hypothetical protein [Salinicola tamaricis]